MKSVFDLNIANHKTRFRCPWFNHCIADPRLQGKPVVGVTRMWSRKLHFVGLKSVRKKTYLPPQPSAFERHLSRPAVTFPRAAAPDRLSFSLAQCEALVQTMRVDDQVDAETTLPDVIHLDYDQDQFAQCFFLSRQAWKSQSHRRHLRRLAGILLRHRTFGLENEILLKEIRARFKHLRFSYVNFDERHRCPVAFDLTTKVMGKMRDGLNNGQQKTVRNYALLLRLCSTRFFAVFVMREVNRFHPSTIESFTRHMLGEVDRLRSVLRRERVTGKEFHEIRKVISRQVALYDAMRILYPSSYHYNIARYLSAINGLMGKTHDELVGRRFKEPEHYYFGAFEFPPELRQRLSRFTEKFPPFP